MGDVVLHRVPAYLGIRKDHSRAGKQEYAKWLEVATRDGRHDLLDDTLVSLQLRVGRFHHCDGRTSEQTDVPLSVRLTS